MALVATAGAANANSYCTQAEATTYLTDRLNSTEWTDATSAQKDAALITATRRIDEERFFGERSNPIDGQTQALKWPRTDTYDDDGNEYDSDTVPERVKAAAIVYALELLKADTLTENPLGNFSYLQAGTVTFKQFTPTTSGKLPADVMRLLRGLMIGAGGARLVRA